MATIITKRVKVTNVKYRNTSFVGNSSYWVTFETENDLLKGYTKPNTKAGLIADEVNGKVIDISYHYTKKGTLIIDSISKVRKS